MNKMDILRKIGVVRAGDEIWTTSGYIGYTCDPDQILEMLLGHQIDQRFAAMVVTITTSDLVPLLDIPRPSNIYTDSEAWRAYLDQIIDDLYSRAKPRVDTFKRLGVLVSDTSNMTSLTNFSIHTPRGPTRMVFHSGMNEKERHIYALDLIRKHLSLEPDQEVVDKLYRVVDYVSQGRPLEEVCPNYRGLGYVSYKETLSNINLCDLTLSPDLPQDLEAWLRAFIAIRIVVEVASGEHGTTYGYLARHDTGAYHIMQDFTRLKGDESPRYYIRFLNALTRESSAVVLSVVRKIMDGTITIIRTSSEELVFAYQGLYHTLTFSAPRIQDNIKLRLAERILDIIYADTLRTNKTLNAMISLGLISHPSLARQPTIYRLFCRYGEDTIELSSVHPLTSAEDEIRDFYDGLQRSFIKQIEKRLSPEAQRMIDMVLSGEITNLKILNEGKHFEFLLRGQKQTFSFNDRKGCVDKVYGFITNEPEGLDITFDPDDLSIPNIFYIVRNTIPEGIYQLDRTYYENACPVKDGKFWNLRGCAAKLRKVLAPSPDTPNPWVRVAAKFQRVYHPDGIYIFISPNRNEDNPAVTLYLTMLDEE